MSKKQTYRLMSGKFSGINSEGRRYTAVKGDIVELTGSQAENFADVFKKVSGAPVAVSTKAPVAAPKTEETKKTEAPTPAEKPAQGAKSPEAPKTEAKAAAPSGGKTDSPASDESPPASGNPGSSG